MSSPQFGAELVFDSAHSLKNVGVLAHKAVTIDSSALVRIRARNRALGSAGVSHSDRSPDKPCDSKDSQVTDNSTAALSQVWVKTPFGPLAMRTARVQVLPDDVVIPASELKDIAARALAQEVFSDELNGEGLATSSAPTLPYRVSAQSAAAWPGFLPVLDGWQTVDYVPATAFRTLERQAREVASESSGPLGLPTSLLDQKVLTVSSGAGTDVAQELVADITMRDVFALCAMGFVPERPNDREPVRVSSNSRWHRLDGRFGSIFTLESLSVLPLVNQR